MTKTIQESFSGVRTAGFTLIELLVVVLIIGILSAIAVPQYQKAVLRTKVLKSKLVLENIIKAEKLYYTANGEYTRDLSLLDIDVGAKEESYGGVYKVDGGSRVFPLSGGLPQIAMDNWYYCYRVDVRLDTGARFCRVLDNCSYAYKADTCKVFME